MSHKIKVKYKELCDTTIYTVYSGHNFNKIKVYTKKGNMLNLENNSAHWTFMCKIRDEIYETN